MTKPAPSSDPSSENFHASDVTSLFSCFGTFSRKTRYHELVMEESASEAALRWHLLAELQGVEDTGQMKAK